MSTARTSRGTNNLEMNVPNIFRLWFDKQIRIERITGGEETVCLATSITSQSLRPITHTMLTPPGIFV